LFENIFFLIIIIYCKLEKDDKRFLSKTSKCVHDCAQRQKDRKTEQQILHSLKAWQPSDGDKASYERAWIAWSNDFSFKECVFQFQFFFQACISLCINFFFFFLTFCIW